MIRPEIDQACMHEALVLANQAQTRGEVPVGAIVVREGEIIGRGCNAPISSDDPTAHAEIVALRDAARRENNYRLPGTTLYVTLEPCPMCVGAMMHARVERVVFGASDPKTGALGGAGDIRTLPACTRTLEVAAGVLADDASALLKAFFAARR